MLPQIIGATYLSLANHLPEYIVIPINEAVSFFLFSCLSLGKKTKTLIWENKRRRKKGKKRERDKRKKIRNLRNKRIQSQRLKDGMYQVCSLKIDGANE